MFKAAVAFVLVMAGAAGTVPSTASAGSKAAVDTKSILKYGTDLQQTDSGAGPSQRVRRSRQRTSSPIASVAMA